MQQILRTKRATSTVRLSRLPKTLAGVGTGGGHLGIVVELCPAEYVELEGERLGALAADLGEARAGRVLTRAMEEIGVRLARVQAAYQVGDGVRLKKHAQGLAAIAGQIGMRDLVRVARDMADLSERMDGAAQAAVMARLARVAEDSMLALWDVKGDALG